MNRPNRALVALAATCLTALVALSGCHRPSESECRKAILNIRKLHGSEGGTDQEVSAAISACQGNATRKSVKCFADAKSIDELKSCEGDMYKQMYGNKDADKGADEKTPAPAAPPAQPAPPAGEGAAVTPEAPPAAAPAQPTGQPAAPAKPGDQGTAAPAPAKAAPAKAAPAPAKAAPAPAKAAPAPAKAAPAPAKAVPAPAPAAGGNP